MRIASLALLALALWLGLDDWRQREITQPAGVLASAEPNQRSSLASPIVVGRYTLINRRNPPRYTPSRSRHDPLYPDYFVHR